MKKQLNSDSLMNELKESSVFFKQPESPSESEPSPTAPTRGEQIPQSPTLLTNDEQIISPMPQETVSKQENMLTSKQARNQENKKESLQVSNQETFEEKILAVLAIPPIKPNTFRYSLEELDFVRDVVYDAEVQYQTKLDKNDVVRIALEWLMNDYREKGEESLLVSILTSKKSRK